MKEKKPADKVRESLEGLKAKLTLRFGAKVSRRITAGLIALGVVLLLIIAAVIFVRIDTIDVTGDVTMFNEGEVISAAEIDIGDGLFWKSSLAIKKNIQENMPLAEKVRVTKTPFGKVTIYIELMEVDYYTQIGEKYYALDKDLTVLDVGNSGSKYSAYGAVLIKIPEVREPVLGRTLVFYDTVEETNEEKETLYPVQDERYYEYVTRFLSALKESGYHEGANGVILTQKYDVTLIYGEKFQVKFGNVNELDVKFRVLYEILAEGTMQFSDRARIDISDPTRPTARTDLTLDFSEYLD